MAEESKPKLRLWLEGTVVTGLLVVGGTFAVAVLQEMNRRQREVACRDNLRALALAVIHYSDDKRFMPHMGRMRDFDGDATTNHGSKAMRALTYYGYLEETTTYVCPSDATSRSLAVLEPAASNPRAWFWNQDYALADLDRSPWVDGAPDPALRDNRELSYQYTRRGYNR
jgi:hypothetical protein